MRLRMECAARWQIENHLLRNPSLPVSLDTYWRRIRWKRRYLDYWDYSVWNDLQNESFQNYHQGGANQHSQQPHRFQRKHSYHQNGKRVYRNLSSKEGSIATKHSRTNAALVYIEGTERRGAAAETLKYKHFKFQVLPIIIIIQQSG